MLGVVVTTILVMATRPARHAADQIVSVIASGNIGQAWDDSAPSFRASVDEKRLAIFAEVHDLRDAASPRWSRVSVGNSSSAMRGTIAVAGARVPATIRLAYAGDRWRLAGIAIDDRMPEQLP